MKQGLIIVGVLLLAGVGFVLTNNDDKADQTSNPNNTQQQTPSPAASSEPQNNTQQSTAKEISYTNDGFSPNSLTVKSGDTVTIKNTSSGTLQFDSDPHPQHTANPELNVGEVASGESKTFTVTKKGEHGYHNHLNSRDTGMLVVE